MMDQLPDKNEISNEQGEISPLTRLLSDSPGMGDELRSLIGQAIKRRRHVIVYNLARKLQQYLSGNATLTNYPSVTDDGGWIKIESLSQLRAAVGGRFKNLKEKWIEAGFPLREHRGDREGKAEVDSEGWIELSVWINKQGFDVRLAEDTEPWLFEVRKA